MAGSVRVEVEAGVGTGEAGMIELESREPRIELKLATNKHLEDEILSIIYDYVQALI